MSELSVTARSALERGLLCDGPGSARRERVKGRVLVALGGGATAAGTVSSVAEAAGSALSGGTVGGALGGGAGVKSLLGTSLLVWFATGIGAGVGVGGLAAVTQHVAAEEVRAPLPAAPKVTEPTGSAHPVAPLFDTAPSPVRELAPAVDLPSRDARPSALAHSAPVPLEALAETAEPSRPDDTTGVKEEASLLQNAQRALAAGQATAALGLLSEHERRFPSGVLAEERRVAKVLGLCALGRTEEATILARAFVARSPRSVLIPRLESSCVGKAFGRP